MNSLLGNEFESYDILSNAIVSTKNEELKKIFGHALAELMFREWESEDAYRKVHFETIAIANAILEVAGH